jgi:hypothetical protein
MTSDNSQNSFNTILEKFEMISEGYKSPSLLLPNDLHLSDSDKIILEQAGKYNVDAVYVRKFNDGRTPIPQIYIYDFIKTPRKDNEITELYRKIWNSGHVPLIFLFFKTEIQILTCLKQPDFDPKTGNLSYSLFEKIHLASKAKKELDKFKQLSDRRFDNGSFWTDSKYKSKFSLKETAYIKLLTELKTAKRDIIKKEILDENLTKKLLVMSILVKYLEEREDKDGNKVFPKRFFIKFSNGEDNFLDVLRKKGGCLRLFDELSSENSFNGEIFAWNGKKEREQLAEADLNSFADFFEGRLDNGQYTFWRLYSFNDLPIELISNIYEEFLDKKAGVVYTPPYLVNLLIDELLPLSDFEKKEFKVLDPACGSGIFLVAAYKRMIQWWKIRNNWAKPDSQNLEELKEILKNNIFGVDIHEEAVRLTFFSLSLVLLDELSPKVIWENLKFDNLIGSNFISSDFFELIENDLLKPEFDLIVGNPPFESKLTDNAARIENKRCRTYPKLPDNQIALLFLDQSITLCKKNASLCLIMPSGPFLYNTNAADFRTYFLNNYHVPQLIDFTFLSQVLFESANVPVTAVFAKNQKPDETDILHITVRRTKPAKEKLYFELDHYDFHKVPFKDALKSRLVWKANLLGGGRLRPLLDRLEPIRSFGTFLSEKKQNEGWKIAEGFIVGNEEKIDTLAKLKEKAPELTDEENLKLQELEKKFQTADYLTGKDTLPTDAFTENGIDDNEIYKLGDKYFIRNRKKNKEIFQAPHLLIKEGVSETSIPVIFREDDLSFRDQIIGIHAPNQADALKKIENRFRNNRTYLFHVAGLSSKYMIKRATVILKHDIESLPYPEDETELNLSDLERILMDDVLNYMLDFRRKGENADSEKPVTKSQLKQFSNVYCKVLNSVYKNLKPYHYFETKSYICFPFYFDDPSSIALQKTEGVEDDLDELIKNNVNSNSRIIRMLRIYENNIIYLIKPKQTRYWLRSVAIRDADETFSDLVAQGF